VSEKEAEEFANWQPLGDVAQCVVESCGADIRDTQHRQQRELDKRRERRRDEASDFAVSINAAALLQEQLVIQVEGGTAR
jgi:hypothetical protein